MDGDKGSKKCNLKLKLCRFTTYHVVSVLLLLLISIALFYAAKIVNGQGVAVTRYMARLMSPVASLFYDDASRNDIKVLLIDDTYLTQEGISWPISGEEHALILDVIGNMKNAKPKAIFIDIGFGQKRDWDEFESLGEQICELKENGVPVFLAAYPGFANGELEVRQDLENSAIRDGKPCFTKVGVSQIIDRVDGVTWSYPLSYHLSDEKGILFKPAKNTDQVSYESAAFAIAKQVANLNIDVDNAPLSILWGSSYQQTNETAFWFDCKSLVNMSDKYLNSLKRYMFTKEDSSTYCPYQDVYSMDVVFSLDGEQRAELFDNKYIFIGAQIRGYNDFAYSPVHGLLPGVMVHAMALDNLLTLGNDYKKAYTWNTHLFSFLFHMLWVLLLVYFCNVLYNSVIRKWFIKLISLAFKFDINRPSKNTVYKRFDHLFGKYLCKKNQVAITFCQACDERGMASINDDLNQTTVSQKKLTFKHQLIILSIKLIEKILKLGVVVALLVFVQTITVMGMIPITELIGMTILAEGLGYLVKTRKTIYSYLSEKIE